jgi:hypothetical protein
LDELAAEIEKLVVSLRAYQQVALLISDRCWILVNSYNAWCKLHERNLVLKASYNSRQDELLDRASKACLQVELDLAMEALAR